MTYQNIQLTVQEGGVARLILNRPDKLNSFNGAMHAEMRAALGKTSQTPTWPWALYSRTLAM
jgi:2-(1,2-epoxy-1,2-dihydrophenyl)acetyl-CoA isomerase